MTFDFSQIDEIRLSKGAHAKPEDGVCFNEAVAWYEGEPHSDRPKCECPVLGAYGIVLNDRMPDDVRNRLLRPLVPLVAGTRDDASEQKRAEFLAMWAVNKVLPVILRERGFADHAEACEKAKTLGEAKAAANAAAAAANAAAYAAHAAFAEQVWTLAVEGFRQAIMLGRHDGFTVVADVLAERHAKLRELVGAA